jgi:serine/threonine protein kinase
MRILAERFVLSNAEPRCGGMAEIHRAADHQDNLRPVAIKFMKGSRIHDDRIVREAFSRELKALQTLEHPNIVRIIDFDPRHDPLYIVLEWLDRDLTASLRQPCLGAGTTSTTESAVQFSTRFRMPSVSGLCTAT